MKTNATFRTFFAAALLFSVMHVSAQEVASVSATPALIMSFTGNNQNGAADLDWVMENETNSKWFVIERSGESGGFDSVSVVPGINDGNQTNYTFCDEHMLEGNNYYRLREVDMNGVVRYSKVITLFNQQGTARMEVYPNPAVATINFTITSPAPESILVQVYSLSGVMLMATQQELAAGNNIQTVAVNNLKAGNYVLKVTSLTGSSQYVQPFVKII